MKKIKFTSLLLVLLLLCSPVGICSAQETMYLISNSQLTQLEQNSIMLKERIANLESRLQNSEEDSQNLKTELEACQVDLKTLQEKSINLVAKSDQLEQTLTESEKSLTRMTKYIEQFEKQAKSKINRLTWQRNIAVGYIIYKMLHD